MMENMMSERDLEIEELKARIAKLEKLAQPSAPTTPTPVRDLTEGMSMPKDALRAMADAVPTVVIREMANGDRVRADLAPLGKGYTTPPLPRSRNLSAAPLEVPGVALADKLMDAADRADRVELAQRLAKQEVARRAKQE
jgi:hypothetical protein